MLNVGLGGHPCAVSAIVLTAARVRLNLVRSVIGSTSGRCMVLIPLGRLASSIC